MAVTGLLALLDDVTAILDDVAVLTKVAAQKTAGIAGDDLAVNAEGLVGLAPARELPIVGKVALGSLANKAVLVPLALALPTAAITPLLMLGGTFLCYEGVHKVAHRHDAHDDAHHDALIEALADGPEALAKVESTKVRQAILTDLVLSAEIVAVSLGAVATEPLGTKAAVLSLVSVGMTVGIYGLVAGIVKIDDVGLHLQEQPRWRPLGTALVNGAPKLMRVISVVGTVAMFLVGGGILLHGFHPAEEALHHAIEAVTHAPAAVWVLGVLGQMAAGVAAGAVAAGVVEGIRRAIAAVRGPATA